MSMFAVGNNQHVLKIMSMSAVSESQHVLKIMSMLAVSDSQHVLKIMSMLAVSDCQHVLDSWELSPGSSLQPPGPLLHLKLTKVLVKGSVQRKLGGSKMGSIDRYQTNGLHTGT